MPEHKTPDFSADFVLLKDAVADAGALVMGYLGKDPQKWDKPGEGPVTEADYAADKLLHERLIGPRPGYGWLSEESADDPSRLDCDAVWIVDPIDGTRAFIDAKPEFSVSAALAWRGEIVAGVVFNPATDETFAAIKSGGATLNGQPMRLDLATAFGDASVLTRRSVWKDENWQGTPPGGKRGYVNSIAYRVSLVAAGRWDAALVLNGLSEWDLAAAQLVLEEAGGAVTNRVGGAITYNKPHPAVSGLIAAKPPLTTTILNNLAPR